MALNWFRFIIFVTLLLLARLEEMEKGQVKLREKPLKNGGKSLYLDIYCNGKRMYEFLQLYLIPENNQLDKKKNKETLRMAEVVKSSRFLEIQEGLLGLKPTSKSDVTLYDYFDIFASKRKPSTQKQYQYIKKSLFKVISKSLLLSQIDKSTLSDICEKIKTMRNRLTNEVVSAIYAQNVFCIIKSLLKEALQDDYIENDVTHAVQGIKATKKEMVYLTIDEVRLMVNNSYAKTEIGKQTENAFLFSVYTGLRFSDVAKLKPSDIVKDSNGWHFDIVQTKTKEHVSVWLADVAKQLLINSYVDDDTPYFSKARHGDSYISKWANRAGVKKRVTFHTSRHTNATLLLNNGVAITTVQKLLGHKSLSSTMVYAKVMDKQKIDAAKALPNLFVDNSTANLP